MQRYKENLEKEQRAMELCLQFNEALGITKMDLIRVESYMDNSKIIFYYYSEGRIDFRELVKQLVKTLKSRVEMRQIGIRHEAKMMGGAAHCGREMCCCLYLDNFKPITLKMARDQNLIPNPSKLSGRCGRLLCCLRYELDESYQDAGLEDEIVELEDTTETPVHNNPKKK
jgi:cell fate regulator YaaT (PSP1 superfamily)